MNAQKVLRLANGTIVVVDPALTRNERWYIQTGSFAPGPIPLLYGADGHVIPDSQRVEPITERVQVSEWERREREAMDKWLSGLLALRLL